MFDASRLTPEARPNEQLLVEALAVIETGIAFLQSVKAWWQEHERSFDKS